jgi:hypothetical protein
MPDSGDPDDMGVKAAKARLIGEKGQKAYSVVNRADRPRPSGLSPEPWAIWIILFMVFVPVYISQ